MVRIITDSAADLDPWEYEQYQVTCIPLTVFIGEQEYQENVNLSKDQFYERIGEGAFPKTAQASPKYLMDAFDEAVKAGEEAVYISISSAISGTYQTAMATREMVGSENCYVVDSRNATGGQRMLVEYAVKLREEGKNAARIVAEVKALRERIVLFACIDTLEYLHRGGRINHTVYKLGSMAQVKPIIRVTEEGSVEVPSKAIGMRKGMDMLCKRLETRKPAPGFPLYVMYTADRRNAELLAGKFRDTGYDIPDTHIIHVGAAIGSHIGPNACGMVYVAEEE